MSRGLLARAILRAARPYRGGGVSMLRGGGACEVENVPGNPTLHGGGLVIGGAVHQEHVVLICGQDLHDLPFCDADFVLFQGSVILHDWRHAVISLYYQNQRLTGQFSVTKLLHLSKL